MDFKTLNANRSQTVGSGHSVHPKPEKGLLNLINQRLEHGSSAADIKEMLRRAGLPESEISAAVEYAMKEDRTAHQRKIADNDFLPPLSKNFQNTIHDADKAFAKVINAEIHHRGLFHGRLRRKDFIMGMLFFFGIAFVFLAIAVTWIQSLLPALWQEILFVIENDTHGAWLVFIPFIFAPITVMLLSLIARRLHNLELPGWISLLYLLVFLTPFNAVGAWSLFGMHAVLLILFVFLIVKKGHPAPNKHGPLPKDAGSIFDKVLGRDQR